MTTTGAHGATPLAAAWYPDPLHRHELRYWDGHGWTEHVADHGQTSTDPVMAAPGATPANLTPSARTPEQPGWTGRINPETQIIVVEKGLDFSVAHRRWRDVPEWLRRVFEEAMLDDEVPVVCSGNRGQLLLTDRALLVGDKSGCVVRFFGRSKTARRFALADITDVDDKGLTCQGVHTKLKWQKGDESEINDGFFALFLRLHPECAQRTVLQDVERFNTAARHVPIEIRHFVGGHSTPMIAASTTTIETQWATATAEAILRPDGAGKDDYFQFIECPACGEWLRFRAHRDELTLCNPGLVNVPGGVYAVVSQRHEMKRL